MTARTGTRTARLVDTGGAGFNGLVWALTVPYVDTFDGTAHQYLATVPGGLGRRPESDGAYVVRLAEPYDPDRVPRLDWARGPLPGSTRDCTADLPEAMGIHLAGTDAPACPTCGTEQLVVGMAQVDPDDYELMAPLLVCGHRLED